ncbi:MAG: ATP-dependent helicase, partial [Aeromicrobium sp.]
MLIEYVRRPADPLAAAPVLDERQQSVVDHAGGPLLVLAGPGTGKTTTLVETVVERIEHRGFAPDEILVLTFSRKAAEELRGRIARRLSTAASSTPTMTFHSFCYGVVREFSAHELYATPLQLMSAPEQQAVIAELVAGRPVEAWPERLHPALRTRGFAAELQGLMAAASTQDLGSADLADLADDAGQQEWAAAAAFFEEYNQVLALQNKSDYTDVVVQAVRLLREHDVRAELRSRFRLVVVDEYQDTDPLQVQLLHELAGDGRDLVVVGDPDQSIYTFRGADVRGILDFPRSFGAPGAPAPTIALGTTRRFGPRILAATRSIVAPLGVSGHLDSQTFDAFRQLDSAAATDGEVEVQTFATATAEGEHIARMLREAHLTADPADSLAWSDMAVLVRTGAELTRLERALLASGVPVEVAGDEIPLAEQPAVRSLLTAVRVADHLAAERPVPADEASAVLTGPIGRLDAAELRRVNRFLRDADRENEGGPRPSTELLAQALRHPLDLAARGVAPATQDALDRAARTAEALG